MTEPTQAAGPREVLARFQRAAIRRSADDLAGLYAVDGIHEFPFNRPGVPARLEGREAIREFNASVWATLPLRYEEYRNVVVHETGDPERIIVEQEVAGTVTTTGRPFTLPNIVVLHVRDGQIVSLRDYVNVLAVAAATGQSVSG